MVRPVRRPIDAAPRWPVLLPLSVAVLAVHLLLLNGGLPLWWEAGTKTSGPSTPALPGAVDDTDTVAAANPEPTAVTPVRSSTVRWIVPQPPPPPPPPPVQKQERPPAPPPAPPPEAVVEPEPAPEPVPEVVVSEAAPEDANLVENMPEAVAPTEPPPVPPSEPNAAQPVAMETAPPVPAASGPRLAPLHLPAEGQLDYEVKGQSKGLQYDASGQLTWRFEGERYEAQTTVKAFLVGSRVYTSVGRLTPQGLAPERFGDRIRSRSEKAAHFDYETRRIRYSRNSADAPLVPGTQDQLSVSLQLALLFHTQPSAYAEGQVITLPVSNASYVEDWKFQIGPLTQLELPAGTVAARLLTRPPRREFDKTLQVWLAPGLGYLPVRLRITEHNGDFVDQLLGSMPAFQLPAPPTHQLQ